MKIIYGYKPVFITYTNKYTGEQVEAYGVQTTSRTYHIGENTYYVSYDNELRNADTNRVCGLNPKAHDLTGQ